MSITPKEFNFMCDVIVSTAKWAYHRREQEKCQGKPLNEKQFELGKAARLTLRSNMMKHTK